jgi:dTDP-4-dehydrorhamnose 3,5-epimerase
MTNRLLFTPLPLSGLRLIQRNPISDHRGSLQRMYCKDILLQQGIKEVIEQINLTLTSRKGAIRGMHFQHAPYAENKMVNCLRGRIFDVAVDLRKNSPTFLKWHAEILTPESNTCLFIPQGFAHGFQTLTENCEILYFHTASYHPEADDGVSPLDPVLNIKWPLLPTEIADKDKNYSYITAQFEGLPYEM